VFYRAREVVIITWKIEKNLALPLTRYREFKHGLELLSHYKSLIISRELYN